MAFQQLAGVALPNCEQRLHFRCVSWRAKSFARQLTLLEGYELHLQ